MTTPTQATRAVVEFVIGARLADMPAQALTLGARCIIDGLGVVLAVSTTDGSRILHAYVREAGETPEATILGTGGARTRAVARLISGRRNR